LLARIPPLPFERLVGVELLPSVILVTAFPGFNVQFANRRLYSAL